MSDDVLEAIARLRDELATVRHVCTAAVYVGQPAQRLDLARSIAEAILGRPDPDLARAELGLAAEYARLREALNEVATTSATHLLSPADRVLAVLRVVHEALAADARGRR